MLKTKTKFAARKYFYFFKTWKYYIPFNFIAYIQTYNSWPSTP